MHTCAPNMVLDAECVIPLLVTCFQVPVPVSQKYVNILSAGE